MTHKILYIASAVMGLAALVIAVVLYWTTYPYVVLEIHRQPIPVKTKQTTPGGAVILEYDYCKKAEVEGTLHVYLVSQKTIIETPTAHDTTHRACEHDVPIPMIVPPQAVPDTYHFHYKAEYRVNPLRTVTEEWDTENFQVMGN